VNDLWIAFIAGVVVGLALFRQLGKMGKWLGDLMLPARYLTLRGVRRRQDDRRSVSDDK